MDVLASRIRNKCMSKHHCEIFTATGCCTEIAAARSLLRSFPRWMDSRAGCPRPQRTPQEFGSLGVTFVLSTVFLLSIFGKTWSLPEPTGALNRSSRSQKPTVGLSHPVTFCASKFAGQRLQLSPPPTGPQLCALGGTLLGTLNLLLS